ncbi:MAG: hypothetical protein ABR543_00840 [Gemmatimonadaceae bacterium]
MSRANFIMVAIAGLAAVFAPPALRAQSREGAEDPIPTEYRPPSGMCRIWLDDVPPGRQPAPTDCATAIRRRPPNSRVVFGEKSERDQRVTPPHAPRTFVPRDKPAAKTRTDDSTKGKPVIERLRRLPPGTLGSIPPDR